MATWYREVHSHVDARACCLRARSPAGAARFSSGDPGADIGDRPQLADMRLRLRWPRRALGRRSASDCCVQHTCRSRSLAARQGSTQSGRRNLEIGRPEADLLPVEQSLWASDASAGSWSANGSLQTSRAESLAYFDAPSAFRNFSAAGTQLSSPAKDTLQCYSSRVHQQS